MENNNLDKIPYLLDYLLGLDEPPRRQQTEKLIAEDADIRRLYDALRRSLRPLEAWQDVDAPAGLTEKTFQFIAQYNQSQNLARASAALADGAVGPVAAKAQTTNGSRFRWVLTNLRDPIALAAGIILVFALLLHPGLRQARRRAHQITCANQLSRIGFASRDYAHDNNGLVPHLPRQPGSKWWLVGRQGEQNVSNTRDAYLLVKQGYLNPKVFLCPGVDNKSLQRRLQIDPQQLQTHQDFPGRQYINYSFRLLISLRPLTQENLNNALPIASDQNPIFARFDSTKIGELKLAPNDQMLQINSPNHARHGQNLLFPDGRVRFVINRFFGPAGDDGFTIQSTFRYLGNELPKSERDIFIH